MKSSVLDLHCFQKRVYNFEQNMYCFLFDSVNRKRYRFMLLDDLPVPYLTELLVWDKMEKKLVVGKFREGSIFAKLRGYAKLREKKLAK